MALSQFKLTRIKSNCILYFNSGNPEGKTYGLLQREDVVPIEISTEPYNNNYSQHHKTRIVGDCLGKGKHYRYPPDNIVGNKDEPVNDALFE